MECSGQIEEILFEALIALEDPGERALLLDEVSRGDPQRRHRLEKLISVSDQAEKFFDKKPGLPVSGLHDAAYGLADAEGEEGLGTRIGRYQLVQSLGEGGCGVVYLAEQLEPVRRRVALKIIRVGMGTAHVIERFDLERQALAVMDHPNIARVLDAGATSVGRPFFVMELVEGLRITDFCDQNRVDIRDRLKLFLPVCMAIQHAHQKGIIHCDIKPSNVLITMHDGVAVPKVIDFGIAKATERDQPHPHDGSSSPFIGTPAYMSPEQVDENGGDVDTRSDIYSLGALLYELLAGKPPRDSALFKQATATEIRNMLRTDPLVQPSARLNTCASDEKDAIAAARRTEAPRLVRVLQGDLDAIVMKAMEHDRHQRYATANGLAADLSRYLDNEPVVARPPDRLYNMGKLVRRNRISFLFGGTVVLLLAVGFGVSTRLFFREMEASNEQERLKVQADLARDNESRLRQLAEYRGLIAQAAVQISYGDIEGADRLLAQVPVELAPPSLEAAHTYVRVGDWHVQAGRWREATNRFAASAIALTGVDRSETSAMSLAFFPAASTSAQEGDRKLYDKIRAIAIKRFTKATDPIVAEQLVKIALLMPAEPETLSPLIPVTDFLERAVNEQHPEIAIPFRTSWCCFSVSLSKFRQGDYASSLAWAERCLSLSEGNKPRDASTHSLMAMIAWRQGRKDAARALLEAARIPIEEVFPKTAAGGDYGGLLWFDWVNARVFYKEALSLIEG